MAQPENDLGAGQHEPHGGALGPRLNWLRAAVLGANDGLVSTAGLVMGVAGATTSRSALLTAGLAGLLAGSLSMAVGEYVSVSSQRDSERAALRLEQRELAEEPEAELAELAGLYEAKGLPPELARRSPSGSPSTIRWPPTRTRNSRSTRTS